MSSLNYFKSLFKTTILTIWIKWLWELTPHRLCKLHHDLYALQIEFITFPWKYTSIYLER